MLGALAITGETPWLAPGHPVGGARGVDGSTLVPRRHQSGSRHREIAVARAATAQLTRLAPVPSAVGRGDVVEPGAAGSAGPDQSVDHGARGERVARSGRTRKHRETAAHMRTPIDLPTELAGDPATLPRSRPVLADRDRHVARIAIAIEHGQPAGTEHRAIVP